MTLRAIKSVVYLFKWNILGFGMEPLPCAFYHIQSGQTDGISEQTVQGAERRAEAELQG